MSVDGMRLERRKADVLRTFIHHHTKFEGQVTGKLEAFVGDEREERRGAIGQAGRVRNLNQAATGDSE